ncbi:MAG: PAS domain-containing protein [Nitrospiraceae bacterium]|nr:PAS domain-containing protein [Nitrospiraceae bacterium]
MDFSSGQPSSPAPPDDISVLKEKLAAAEESGEKLKKIIETLLERESNYRILAELGLDIVFIVGQDGRVRFINDYAAGFLAKPPEDIVGRPLEELFPPGLFEFQGMSLQRVFQTGDPVFMEDRLSFFGRKICLDTRLIPVRDKEGMISSVLGISRDITERKQREGKIKTEEEFLSNVFESIHDAIAIIDRDFNFLRSNRVMNELYGIRELSGGQKCFAACHGRQEICEGCLSLEVLNTGRPIAKTMTFEQAGIKREGWMDLNISPLVDREGQIIGVVQIMRDVTARQMMEAEIQKTQRLESLGALAGGIAHEFNNILAMIIGNIDLSKRYPVTGELKDILNEAEKASMKGKHLASQMLAFSKTGEVEKKALGVEDLVRYAVSLSAASGPNKFKLLLPAGLRPVFADEGQMGQAVINMLMNAHQAMPEGGTIVVRAENVTVKQGELPPLEEGNYVKISFEDRGPEIAPEDLPRIFEPFSGSGRKDTGFGLAIAYSIVNRHGGTILAESGPGVAVPGAGGRTFTMYIPALPEMKSAEKDGGREEDGFNPVYSRGKILLMDDEEGVRVVVARMLEQCGYAVDLANDGDMAVEMYRASLDEESPYSAVILDLVVSSGPGGKETVKKLMEMDPSVRAIASTGYYSDPVMSRFDDYGFKEVLAKPFLVSEMNRVLGKVIRKKEPS